MFPGRKTWSVRLGVLAISVLSTFAAAPAHAAPPTQPWDLAAIGATASGPAGSVVRVRVGVKDLGPGTVPAHRGVMGSVTAFTVELPPGVTLVRRVLGCTDPFDQRNNCETVLGRALGPGQSQTNQYDLRIGNITGTVTGHVRVTFKPGFESPDLDTNHGNDSAPIAITRTAASGGSAGLPVTGTRTAPLVVAG